MRLALALGMMLSSQQGLGITQVPTPGPGRRPVHINVWQFQGRPPAGGRDVEVVIRSFSYQP